jgi:hypothetical protein
MLSNTARISVGRLLEVRAGAGFRSAVEVDELFDQIERGAPKRAPGYRVVTVADWRQCPIMAPDAAERIAQRMAARNSITERSAALASREAPVAVLQFLRVIRDAGHVDRKLFFEAGDLLEWLTSALTAEEMARARQFLAEAR